MNKLNLAHDYILKAMSTQGLHIFESDIVRAFDVAEMMLEEEQKRKDTTRPSVFLDQIPDWDSAPDWANYWAFDQSGSAHWFESLPVIEDEPEWVYGDGRNNHERDESFCIAEDWKYSLQKRPKEPQQ